MAKAREALELQSSLETSLEQRLSHLAERGLEKPRFFCRFLPLFLVLRVSFRGVVGFSGDFCCFSIINIIRPFRDYFIIFLNFVSGFWKAKPRNSFKKSIFAPRSGSGYRWCWFQVFSLHTVCLVGRFHGGFLKVSIS